MTDLCDRLLTSEEVEKKLGVGPGWCAKDPHQHFSSNPHVKIREELPLSLA